MKKLTINEDWTLFLDRDGVINHEIKNGYANFWTDIHFYDGVTEAFKIFAAKFKYIFIVTNQRGVGKGVTKLENLHLIHTNMRNAIETTGGRIDAIYYCADLDLESNSRKPNTGMALRAKADFKDLDFTKSIMVGNNTSDIQFGQRIGAKTVLLLTTMDHVPAALPAPDGVYTSLIAFAQTL